MNAEKVKRHIHEAEKLLEEIQEMTKNEFVRGSLSDLVEEFYNLISRFDHGERDRFYVPYWNALKRVESLEEKIDEKFYPSLFKTYQNRLSSILKQYIEKMNKGLQELYQE